MIKVTKWFTDHRLDVHGLFEEKKPSCRPNPSWWILLHFVHEIAGMAAKTCRSLQGRSTLLCNQHEHIKQLVTGISYKLGIVGPLSEDQHANFHVNRHKISASGNFGVGLDNVKVFLEDLGSFVSGQLAEMLVDDRIPVLRDIAAATLGLVDDVSGVVAERDENNNAFLSQALAVLPHQLVQVAPRVFAAEVLLLRSCSYTGLVWMSLSQ